MDEWLRRYTTKSEADIPALKECLEGIQPRDISWLMRSIRRHDSPTAAIIAAQTGHTEVSRLLLTRLRESADELLCEEEDVGGATALQWAALVGHDELVELLLDAASHKIRYKLVAEKIKTGEATALLLAAGRGRTKSVKCLLKSFSAEERDTLLKMQCRNLGTSLHRAARGWHAMALYTMLGFATLETISFILDLKNREKRTLLKKAQHEKKRETAELLMRWQQQPILEGRIHYSINYSAFAESIHTQITRCFIINYINNFY